MHSREKDEESGINTPLLEKGKMVLKRYLKDLRIWPLSFSDYLKKCEPFRDSYHGVQLNGPNCVILFSKLDTLEQILSKDLFGHIDALGSFEKLREGHIRKTTRDLTRKLTITIRTKNGFTANQLLNLSIAISRIRG
ncbi:unnamed protein product [Lepeophtheirus salmonis]|uniref:(salmon louse) hypothetical protein n=1 Tax=Lepeophtheirus salmonis TaxID=72036 RepID=A0A7R8D0D2_LEPSM|nr:unnamed protein product [Lepeophtheirus salmonis]CAF2982877.1 unnamed protein product [Lepeophtheirus salmonis]